MFGKNRKKKVGICVMVVTASLVLAVLWAVLATPETALAKPPAKETIRFDVDVTGDMLLKGTFNPDGTIQPGLAEGRAGKSNVVVNRPSPAIQMDFLAELSCFAAGDFYSLDYSGTLDIGQNKNGTAYARYFFRAFGKDGELTSYRIDADAEIVADTGGSFPKGDSGYTVTLSNIRLSVDTGSRKNGCKDSFPDASATIRLVRIQ